MPCETVPERRHFMSRINSTRRGCKDVFHAFMVNNSTYDSELEIPCIKPEEALPKKIISFSKAVGGADYGAWIHFYEDDVAFERLWNNPFRYLPMLKRYSGVIAPDFSLYRDMPLVMQFWNIYRSHAVATWLQSEGVPVIANVRWGDSRTYSACCAGVPRKSAIAIGSHGCLKLSRERRYFAQGLRNVVDTLCPSTIVVYGAAPGNIFDRYKKDGIAILQFDSDFAVVHRKAVNY